jgi:hypothetical protein
VRARKQIRAKRTELGIALLISIFILLLISVVAIALIVSSSTESSLAGNYRSSTGVYYAATAGLEEARRRLAPKDSNSFKNTAPGFLPSPGTPLAIGSVGYVLNPGPTEALGTMLATYPDAQYDTEFGAGALGAATVTTTASIWNRNPLNGLTFPAPLYKWVRINAVTEQSLNLLVAPFASGPLDNTTPVYYDGVQLNISNSGSQVLEITALAVLPNLSQKLLQYIVAPAPISLPNFPAALTLVGVDVNYDGPDSTTFFIDGTDSFHSSFGSCTPGATVYVAIGYTNPPPDGSLGRIRCCVMLTHPSNYIGFGGSMPNVRHVVMLPTFQTPSDYNNLVQNIIQNADATVFTPNASTSPSPYTLYGASLTPLGMSNTNPQTIVVNGNLDLTGWHNQGYGLLVVTGNLIYDPDASWYGIIMVVGKGLVNGDHGGSGEFDGTVLAVQTLDPATGAPLGSLGTPQVLFTPSMGGKGIYYSTCWIKNSLPTSGYKVLSFHEISQ